MINDNNGKYEKESPRGHKEALHLWDHKTKNKKVATNFAFHKSS